MDLVKSMMTKCHLTESLRGEALGTPTDNSIAPEGLLAILFGFKLDTLTLHQSFISL